MSTENHSLQSRRFQIFSYAVIALALIKDLWAIWLFKDITGGDTSSYYGSAITWLSNYTVNMVWSPLYTSFYGTALMATHDPYGATILHRIIIVLLSGFGSLMLLRRMLSPGIALAIALWWCLLPINFNTLYEVHLFSLLPVLCALILASGPCGPFRKGVIIGLLLCTTILVRNETSVVLAIFALFCLVEEVRYTLSAPMNRWSQLARRLASYSAPIALSIIAILVFYWRSSVKFPAMAIDLAEKQKLNACQIYAAGYAQRHPEFVDNAMTDCSGLMQRVFGLPEPTLHQMIAANPFAVLRHYLWNLSLIPNGLELALFNATGGSRNPDYITVDLNNGFAHVGSVLVLVILAWGARKFWVARRENAAWIYDKRYFLLMAICLTASSLIVSLSTRPRPSYLFAFTLCLMTVIGLALDQIVAKRSWAVIWTMGAISGLVVVTIPFYYPSHARPRYVLNTLRAVEPFVGDLSASKHIVLGDYAFEQTSYLAVRAPGVKFHDPGLKIEDYKAMENWDGVSPISSYLFRNGIDAFYAQPRMVSVLMGSDAGRSFLSQPNKSGWIGYTLSEDGDYRLFVVDKNADLAQLEAQAAAEEPKDKVIGRNGVSSDGWMQKDGTFTIRAGVGGTLVLKGTLPGGIGIQGSAIELSVPGHDPVRAELVPGPFSVELPIMPGDLTVSYHFEQQGTLPNGDGRLVGGHLESIGFVLPGQAADKSVATETPTKNRTPLLSSTGVSSDGWMQQEGLLHLDVPRAENLIVRGMVPGGIGISTVELNLAVAGGQHVRQTLTPGSFAVTLPVGAGRSDVEFSFSQVGILPNGDGRSVSARLGSVDLQEGPIQETPKATPSVVQAVAAAADGIYMDGWMQKSGSISLLPDVDGELVLTGLVPGGVGLESQHVTIRAPGEKDASLDLKPGSFSVAIQVRAGGGQVSFNFAQESVLPNGDGRPAAALLQAARIQTN